MARIKIRDATGADRIYTTEQVAFRDADGGEDVIFTEGTGADIVPLEVTVNGEYTAPEGQAYSPVTVNVPTGGDSEWAEYEAALTPITKEDLETDDDMYVLTECFRILKEVVA